MSLNRVLLIRLHFINVKLLYLMVALAVTACGQETPTTMPTLTPANELFDYQTSTPILESPTPKNATIIPSTPDPTPTPFTHTVERGETMLGIAIQYGITLEDLQAANSEADPNMLSVGTQLIIPLGEDVQTSVLTPTPLPINITSLVCYPTADQGAWCFTLVENHFSYALENVSARVGLFSEEGSDYLYGTAYSPLNRIGSNESVPLMVFFPPPVPSNFTSRAELLTAVAVPESSIRYLDAGVEIESLSISSDGLSATVQGEIVFPPSTRYPRLVWLAVIAYDESGEVAGVRKWEVIFPQNEEALVTTDLPQDGTTEAPISFSPLPYDVDVYSLGPAIERVEILIEVRP